jgi:hypothetical protein
MARIEKGGSEAQPVCTNLLAGYETIRCDIMSFEVLTITLLAEVACFALWLLNKCFSPR